MSIERRRHPRIDSINLLAYTSYEYEEGGRIASQGMGRTLNVSESGILLETHEALGKGLLCLTLALEEDLVDLKGKVVRSTHAEDGSFSSGIEFVNLGERETEALKQYIAAFKASRPGQQ
ncbi:MAG: PilZ domain-containing protein [Deltaproteobacteria bacterium]|nr:PilZ domain-containing protein [Deltaproteobacteria bacterium]